MTVKLMGIREYARHRKTSHKAVQQAIDSGRIYTTKDSCGKIKINPVDADKAWTENTDPSKVPLSMGGAREDPDEFITPDDLPSPEDEGLGETPEESMSKKFLRARTEKEYYSAELKRLDFEKKSGLLVSAEQVRRELFNVGRLVKDALLNLPAKISHELASETDPHKIAITLEKELRGALEELCKDIPE